MGWRQSAPPHCRLLIRHRMTAMTRCLILTFLLLFAGLPCCPAEEPAGAAIQVTATAVSPTNIQVNWRDPQQNVAGHIVEWCTAPQGRYIILAFLLPGVNSFVHPNLMPQTRCCYRVRPYFGPASNEVQVTTGKRLPNQKIKVADATWWQQKIIPPATPVKTVSIKDPATAADGAPTDLKAELVTPTGIHFTWTDHAGDEDGFMLEIKPAKAPDYHICAIIKPNVNSYGYGLVPPETTVSFRVRAYYYGKPSNIAGLTVGESQSEAQK
jgi:hypothetical protein